VQTTPPEAPKVGKPLKPDKGKKKRRRLDDPGGFPEEAKRVVRTLMGVWPTRDPEDDRPIRIDQFASAQRVSKIMAERNYSADTLIQGGKLYLAQKPKRYKALQYFFGPGNGKEDPPWMGYVNGALEMEKKQNAG
jgi:hypothetical protein